MNDNIINPADRELWIENHPFDELRVGASATLQRTLTKSDILLFAKVSGDVNPAHVDAVYAKTTRFGEIIAHGMLGGSLISTVLGTEFPGPGTIYVGQTLRFLHPVHPGDTLTVTVTVASLDPVKHRATLDTRCVDQDGAVVIEGQADVVPPREKLRIRRTDLPDVLMADKNLRYHQLLAAARACEPIRMAVVHPCSREALEGALDAARLGLIQPVLVGPVAKIRAVAAECGIELGSTPMVDVPHSQAAALKAVAMAQSGEVQALMKGSLHTDELMAEVVTPQNGLRTERRISHVFVLDVPRYAKPLLVTDAAINIEPDFEAKADIVRNAIDLAHALGIARPKVALLSALETVTPKLRSSMDAAALCKMAERGQINGAALDGPLAFDNAVSSFAAGLKGIRSEVAGDADVLVVPNLEAGNILAKQLEYLADAQAAGVVLGAKVPIVLTSRADTAHSRVASCAVALLAHHQARIA
ncbi:MAG: bifunctional enoyl-CoA hydratase/phosphate acetyltransferase [Burkholderiales bacterium]|nr:bifunctional enoyl-CoA hydratase/phosphate acetyltransferase [Burkholderiales bacterium]